METWYRAICCRRPVGPWRTDIKKARQDLIEKDLGGYDEWGTFFSDALGSLETMSERSQSRAA